MSNPTLKELLLPKAKLQIVFSGIIGLIAALFTWLVSAANSPLHEYVIWHTWLPNLWGIVNLIPSIFGLIVSGNVHAPSDTGIMIGVIIQWFVIGLLLSIPIANLFALFRRWQSRDQ
jgi:hypothetical protein